MDAGRSWLAACLVSLLYFLPGCADDDSKSDPFAGVLCSECHVSLNNPSRDFARGFARLGQTPSGFGGNDCSASEAFGREGGEMPELVLDFAGPERRKTVSGPSGPAVPAGP